MDVVKNESDMDRISPVSTDRMDKRRIGTRALVSEEADRVKEALVRLLAEAGTQRELARRVGVTPQAISRVLTGGDSGPALARKVADAMGVPLELLLRGDTSGESGVLEPRFGNLSGWAEAEAEARRRFRHVPSEAFDAVRDLRGARTPDVVTSEWIGQMAGTYAMALRGEGEDVDPD